MSNIISATDMTEFVSELTLLLEMNFSCKEALETLQYGSEQPAMHQLVNAIRQEVERDGQLATALAHYPEYFEPVIVEMLRRGEQQGLLAATLRKIADYRESKDVALNELIARLTLTSIYPIVLFLFTLALMLVLLVFPVQTFADMFKGFGAELPALTQAIVQLSDFVIAHLGLIVAAIGVLVGYLEFLRRQGLLIFMMPLFGKLFHKAMVIQFLRGYALLYSPSMTPAQTLEGCAQLLGNAVYAKRVRQMSAQLAAGQTLTDVLMQWSDLPKRIVHIAALGLKTQKLDELFNKMASRYTQQLQHATEPTIRLYFVMTTLLLGVFIGCFVIAMYLPIFKMGSVI